jgi:hypothetical protein
MNNKDQHNFICITEGEYRYKYICSKCGKLAGITASKLSDVYLAEYNRNYHTYTIGEISCKEHLLLHVLK